MLLRAALCQGQTGLTDATRDVVTACLPTVVSIVIPCSDGAHTEELKDLGEHRALFQTMVEILVSTNLGRLCMRHLGSVARSLPATRFVWDADRNTLQVQAEVAQQGLEEDHPGITMGRIVTGVMHSHVRQGLEDDLFCSSLPRTIWPHASRQHTADGYPRELKLHSCPHFSVRVSWPGTCFDCSSIW